MQIQMPNLSDPRLRELALRGLATFGLVVLLALGAWGVARVAVSVPSLLSSIGAAAVSLSSVFVPNERLELELPETVTSGELFDFSWRHLNRREEGTYTLSFSCRKGLILSAEASDGSMRDAFCDTPFNFTNTEGGMKLRATSALRRIDIPLTLSFTKISDGAVSASNDTILVVENAGAPEVLLPSPSASAPERRAERKTYTVTAAGRASNPLGKPDLVARINAIGIYTERGFTPSQSVKVGTRAAVRFEIENVGTKTADGWAFNVVLPTSPYFIYHSDMQPFLGPGDKIQYTLAFDQIDTRVTGGVVTVNADPGNRLLEPSEENNIAKDTYIVLLP